MNEMEKAQVIYKLKKGFVVSDEILSMLLNQIVDPEIANNFNRICRGLAVEDYYQLIFSALPWIKNINGLDQEQEKQHKEEYQVPDYSILIENNDSLNFPILVDVKSVKGDKQSCKIMGKQAKSLQNYASDNKIPLLIAIYWEKLGYWTHNCLENFGKKKNYKIHVFEAIKNDLSHILSDYSYIIDQKFYRRTKFKKIIQDDVAYHENYGEIINVEISKDGITYKKYTLLESAIIDSIFTMKEVNKNTYGEETVLIDETRDYPMIVKLTNWIIRVLEVTNAKPDERINDKPLAQWIRILIVELMKDLGYMNTYQIPASKNPCTEFLFQSAYDKSSVMDYYNISN